MDTTNKPAKDHIVDFIDDEEYYAFRKYKAEVEKGTLAIYIFSTLTLFGYVFFLTTNNETFDWLDFAINILIIAVYYLLGYYSTHQPFTSFVSALCLLTVVTVLQLLFTSRFNVQSVVVKAIYIVFICMKLEAAKKVQDYERKYKSN